MGKCPFCKKYFEINVYDKHLSYCIEFENEYKNKNKNYKMDCENENDSFNYILCKQRDIRNYDCYRISNMSFV